MTDNPAWDQELERLRDGEATSASHSTPRRWAEAREQAPSWRAATRRQPSITTLRASSSPVGRPGQLTRPGDDIGEARVKRQARRSAPPRPQDPDDRVRQDRRHRQRSPSSSRSGQLARNTSRYGLHDISSPSFRSFPRSRSPRSRPRRRRARSSLKLQSGSRVSESDSWSHGSPGTFASSRRASGGRVRYFATR